MVTDVTCGLMDLSNHLKKKHSSAITCGCRVLSNFAKDPIFGTDWAIIAHTEWVFLLSKKLFLGAITELRPNF